MKYTQKMFSTMMLYGSKGKLSKVPLPGGSPCDLVTDLGDVGGTYWIVPSEANLSVGLFCLGAKYRKPTCLPVLGEKFQGKPFS